MAIGTAALILGSGLSDGIARQLTDNLVAVQTGEIMVVRREDGFVPQNSPFDAYSNEGIGQGETVILEIEREARRLGIARVAPYLHARGTAIASNRSTPAVILGIVPEREPELFKALPPRSGAVLSGEPEEVYVGEPVAKILRLGVGDSVSLLIQTQKGAMNSLDAVVCGIFTWGALVRQHFLCSARSGAKAPGRGLRRHEYQAEGPWVEPSPREDPGRSR